MWTQNTGITPFCAFPGAPEATSLNKVSDDNNYFIGTTNAGGFLYSIAGGVVPLGNAFVPNGVSRVGDIVVGNAADTALIWDEKHGERDLKTVLEGQFGLNLTGWTLKSANDVSSDGTTIVGWGINPQGLPEGWVARIPEPNSALLLLFASGMFLCRHHRQALASPGRKLQL